jgi:hypothetical protein
MRAIKSIIFMALAGKTLQGRRRGASAIDLSLGDEVVD